MTERIKRFYDVITKHNGKRVLDDINRAEFDFSIVYELLALEDYIKELEHKIAQQEVIIADQSFKLLKNKKKVK